MPSRPATITQAQIALTVKAMSGIMAVGRVEVDHIKGTVNVWPAGAPEAGATSIDAMVEGFK